MKPEMRQAINELIKYYFVDSIDSGETDWDHLNELLRDLAIEWVRYKKEEA